MDLFHQLETTRRDVFSKSGAESVWKTFEKGYLAVNGGKFYFKALDKSSNFALVTDVMRTKPNVNRLLE